MGWQAQQTSHEKALRQIPNATPDCVVLFVPNSRMLGLQSLGLGVVHSLSTALQNRNTLRGVWTGSGAQFVYRA